ncbi:MAG: M28 family peptidase [Desulfobacteraceae bacterium]|nr:M28 family peptidase [Desulfobacteraceae bacterium]
MENDLALNFCCAGYQGKNYKFTLNYTPYPADTTGYYWKMDLSTFSDADQIIIAKPALFSLEKTITAEALMAHLKAFDDIANAAKDTGYRLSGTPGYVKTVEYIKDKLANSGLTVSEQQIVYEGGTAVNLFAETTGDDNQVIIVGAHLDSVAEGPGLNDDGTGSAALLELAVQIGYNKDFKPVNKIRFAWWAFEEPGMIGSTHYVNNLSAAEKAKIGMYLNLDMIGTGGDKYYYGIEDSDFSISKNDPNVPPAYIDVFNAYPAYVSRNGEIKKAFAGYFENYPVLKSDIVFSALHGNMDYEAFLLNRIPFGGLYSGKDACNHLACDNYQNINKDVLLINTKAIAYVAQFYAEKIRIVHHCFRYLMNSGVILCLTYQYHTIAINFWAANF